MQSNVPREKVPWFPTVDLDACIGDQECLKFCKNDVFVWDELNSRPVVGRPSNCVLGCSACAEICPAEAISFPSKEELRRVLRALREQSAPEAVFALATS
jgi:NAD-dependent dihydropyrimidine dehydrogenase PreA subunit